METFKIALMGSMTVVGILFFAVFICILSDRLPSHRPKKADETKPKIELTCSEGLWLFILILTVGICYGFILSCLHSLNFILCVVLFLCLGPGTWFFAFGRFGVRGRERVAFIRDGIGLFNLLGSFISLFTAALIYALHFL